MVHVVLTPPTAAMGRLHRQQLKRALKDIELAMNYRIASGAGAAKKSFQARVASAGRALALAAAVGSVGVSAADARNLPQPLSQAAYLTPAGPTNVERQCDAYVTRATTLRGDLERENGRARIQTTFRRFDRLMETLDLAAAEAAIISSTNPSPDVAAAADACSSRINALLTEVWLSPAIYRRLHAIEASDADAVVRHLLMRTVARYERAGVGADEPTRMQISALQNRMTQNSIVFSRNLAQDRSEIFATRAELEGLPADFIAGREADAEGRYRITMATTDRTPVMSYAANDDVRRRLFEAYFTRGHPANNEVLRQILSDRAELARLLGRPNFAALELEDKMIGTPENALRLLDEFSLAAEGPARRDYQTMLDRLRVIDPEAGVVPAWSSDYLQQLVRTEQYGVDPQEVRRYFAYSNVRDGILRLTEDMFGVEIRPWDTPVWADGVEAYEMYEEGRLIGRFYLDNHPRSGKPNLAFTNFARTGLAGHRIPTAVIVATFPMGDHQTGLMEHRQVEIFLHEFGHVLHILFSGRHDWHLANFAYLEWDAIETPSTLLEKWVWDYETLRRFAVDASGRAIPHELVDRMNRARSFGAALEVRRQLGASAVSLRFHLQAPGDTDLAQAYRAAYHDYSLLEMPEFAQPQASFGHLLGYSAYFYTYVWSAGAAEDLFTAFRRAGLRDRATARRYRETVLAPGSSRPAATSFSEFLGRPLGLAAYRTQLNGIAAENNSP